MSALGIAMAALSRPDLSEEDSKHFLHIAKTVSSWNGFGELASRAHCAPLILRNLQFVSSGVVPESEILILARATRRAAMRNLRNEAEIRYIEGELLSGCPSGGVYVKGATLARRYYGNASLRTHRDIDILLCDEDRLRFMQAAVSSGFRFFVAGQELEVSRASDLYALFKFGREVSLVSPRNAVIEIHESVDKSMGIFPTKTLLEVAERQDFLGTSLLVLPTHWLYCYLAYHACQHNWSKFIWMVDMFALGQSPGFSIEDVRSVARDAGILAAVEASHAAAGRFERLEFGLPRSTNRRTGQIIEACLQNNGMVTKGSGSPEAALTDLSQALWLGDGMKGVKFYVNRLLFLSSPALDDYRMIPTARNHFWILFVLRPALFLIRRIRSRVRLHRGASRR